MAAAVRKARSAKLERREELMLSAMVMTGSSVVRRFGSDRAGEIAAHRFLDHDDTAPEDTIAAAAERTLAAARGHTVLLVQDTTEINFAGADREGDIDQHFARPPEGVEQVVRAHHDRSLVSGGAMFAAAEGFGAGFVREVVVPPRARRRRMRPRTPSACRSPSSRWPRSIRLMVSSRCCGGS